MAYDLKVKASDLRRTNILMLCPICRRPTLLLLLTKGLGYDVMATNLKEENYISNKKEEAMTLFLQISPIRRKRLCLKEEAYVIVVTNLKK